MKSQASKKLFLKKKTITELSGKQLSTINGGSLEAAPANDTSDSLQITTSQTTASSDFCSGSGIIFP